MAPTPKPPGQRRRRNIDQGKWKKLPAARAFERPPPLPPKRRGPDEGLNRAELARLSRRELNAVAAEAGIENPPRLKNKAAVIKALEDKESGWLESTRTWWVQLWASPMAGLWIETDVKYLVELANFNDLEERGVMLPGPQLTRKTHLEDRYGLSPKARRQLQWEIARAEEERDESPSHRMSSRRRGMSAVERPGDHALARR